MKTTTTLAAARKQGFFVECNLADHKLANQFFRWCEQVDAPYVTVKPKTKYAVVSVDLIGQSYRMGEQAEREISALLTSANVGRRKQENGSNHVIVYANRIPIEQAADVARRIIDILARPGFREPHFVAESDLVRALDRALADGSLAESVVADD
jgi:hypothetical protein